MMVVYKYPLSLVSKQHVQMPLGAKILSVAKQREQLCLWALVDTEAVSYARLIEIHGTGQRFKQSESQSFVGTVFDVPFVWHVFDCGVVRALPSVKS